MKFTRVKYRTGIITSIDPEGDTWETCEEHETTWLEGDTFARMEGAACEECISKSKTIFSHANPELKEYLRRHIL